MWYWWQDQTIFRLVKCCPMSNLTISFQGIWSGDVEEKHRHSGRWLPGNTHHRVKSTFLRFGCPYQRNAWHSKSPNKSNHCLVWSLLTFYVNNHVEIIKMPLSPQLHLLCYISKHDSHICQITSLSVWGDEQIWSSDLDVFYWIYNLIVKKVFFTTGSNLRGCCYKADFYCWCLLIL